MSIHGEIRGFICVFIENFNLDMKYVHIYKIMFDFFNQSDYNINYPKLCIYFKKKVRLKNITFCGYSCRNRIGELNLMKDEIENFISYLHRVRKTSQNTEVSYRRDLQKMSGYFERQGIELIPEINSMNLNSYIIYLENNNFAAATISRNIASAKAFFSYLLVSGKIDSDPTLELKAPKVEKKSPDILSIEDVTTLLEQPCGTTPKKIRDKAMLELLYATGIRVSELLSLTLMDINMPLNYIICRHKERMIPFGAAAKSALMDYLEKTRELFLNGETSDILFTNCSGQPMSRQGFWKLIKYYAKKAGIQAEITPHTLRHSFAAHMVGNGADLKSVQEMLGYSDISTTGVYMSVNANKIRTIYQNSHPRC